MHIALHVSVSWTSSFKLYVHSISLTSDFSTALQHMEKRSAHLPGVTVGLVLFSTFEIVCVIVAKCGPACRHLLGRSEYSGRCL